MTGTIEEVGTYQTRINGIIQGITLMLDIDFEDQEENEEDDDSTNQY